MSTWAIILIALSLSTDTFAVSFAKNSNLRNKHYHILIQGLMFGLSEMLMFMLGWIIASRYSNLITTIDHWIAFSILVCIGSHMMYAAITETGELLLKNSNHFLSMLVIIGTSIDAAAVGITFAFIEIDILFPAVVIGLSSFIMSILAILLSKKTGVLLGRYAELLGGSVLILIGAFILYSHL